MKNKASNLLLGLLFLALAVAFVYGVAVLFNQSEYFRSLFTGTSAPGGVLGKVDPAAQDTLASRTALAGKISMYIFAIVIAIQMFAFFLAIAVLGRIRKSGHAAKVKFKQLEAADIFFDVPLYIGLFGTVSSFLVMAYSPQSARLIAYSSTLIGIIFSLVLRVTLLYPLRSKLLISGGDEK